MSFRTAPEIVILLRIGVVFGLLEAVLVVLRIIDILRFDRLDRGGSVGSSTIASLSKLEDSALVAASSSV